MAIKLGNNTISLKVGSADVGAVYLGSTMIYSGGTPPTPPSFNGKWLATYSDSHTESAECDASSAITQGEMGQDIVVAVEIGDCVTSIDYGAFSACTSLTSITIPDSVTSIGDYAFKGCTGLTSINLPSGLTSIGVGAFQSCSGLTSINIPNSVTSIGDTAFEVCTSLSSLTIGSGVTSIGNSAFYGCTSLTSVTIPDSVTSLGNQAFYGCSGLTSVTIGNSVTSIGDYAFSWCSSLTSLDIPDSVASIGISMIGDSGIQTITIGSGITYIDNCGLCNNNLTNGVIIKAVNPPIIPNCNWIFAVQSLIYVPAESVTAYQNDQCWSAYAQGILPIPNS